jgi:hypothetical protein
VLPMPVLVQLSPIVTLLVGAPVLSSVPIQKAGMPFPVAI